MIRMFSFLSKSITVTCAYYRSTSMTECSVLRRGISDLAVGGSNPIHVAQIIICREYDRFLSSLYHVTYEFEGVFENSVRPHFPIRNAVKIRGQPSASFCVQSSVI
uniref:Uncharacterized protein n=1 Tax=Cacopsylla melanoneura TaxID=428564 RepID=A0A8D8RJ18_9HEMI